MRLRWEAFRMSSRSQDEIQAVHERTLAMPPKPRR
jgi:hypothetical protein